MAEYTDIENALIEKIADKKLRDSLILIRDSTIAVWSDDAPRIIQGYTDHGFNHCLRLLGWASKLLNTNKGKPLSDEEMYLLIAGIYLHDIGMQCDVTKFSEIKEKAIEFGAVFNIDFTATNPNKYSDNEQIEIRNNHQYLSAAWIDFGFRNPETTLGTAIKSVPKALISDLIDICKYHSKLIIEECPLYFKMRSNERKQLIASLVRFSDELDVDKSRVSIDTVMLFSLESENKFYWWLHHLTQIDINDNILTLKVSLNSLDYSEYKTFVKDTYIEHFRIKNKSVLDILKNNNFSISISSDSEVISDEYIEKLPNEIKEVIKEIQNKDVVEKNKSTLDIKQNFQNRLRDFPIPKPYFSGRVKELQDFKEAFGQNCFVSIEGGGGIGKTQLVAKSIEELKIQEQIVWFECTPNSLPDDLIKGAGFEELFKGKDKTEREKFSAFKEKIEENKLVVFLDNYQDVENVPAFKSFLEFINDYLKKGHLIVLGRNKINRSKIQPKRLPLQGLGDDSLLHAQNLIKHSYPELKSVPIEDLKSLCEKLKGYPLAVDLAVYLLSLHVNIDNILTVAVSDAKYDSTIEEMSTRLLNEIFTRSDASEEERNFLKLLSIFRGKIETTEALSVIPQDIFDRASRELFKKNLLEFNENYLELHPLVREFSYDKLENRKELHLKVSEYYLNKRNEEWNPELEEKIFYHLSCAEDWIKISDTIINSGREIILHGYLDRLQQMITLVKDQGITKSIFDIYEGDIAQIKGEWNKALSIFGISKQSLEDDVRIEGMIKYGEILYRQGNVKASNVFFEEIVAITENKTNNKLHARALNDLGLVYEFFGNLTDALITQNKALRIRKELGEQEDIACSLTNIGSIKSALGFKNDALKLSEESLKIREEIGDKSGIANSLNNIGLIKSDLGFKNDALKLFEDSLKINEEIGDKSRIASSLNNIGSIKNALGFKNDALKLYEESLKINEEIGDKSGIAGSLNNIGSIKSALGFKNDALKFLEASLKIKEEIGDKSGIAMSLNNIGLVKSTLGFKMEAFELYEESLKIRKEIGDKSGIANSLNNIGAYLFENNLEIEKACFYLLKSLALYKFMSNPNEQAPINYLFQMRKNTGLVKFESMVIESIEKLDNELKNIIDINEILGKPIKVEKRQGRNDPCNCNSGKKYKHCCGKMN